MLVYFVHFLALFFHLKLHMYVYCVVTKKKVFIFIQEFLIFWYELNYGRLSWDSDLKLNLNWDRDFNLGLKLELDIGIQLGIWLGIVLWMNLGLEMKSRFRLGLILEFNQIDIWIVYGGAHVATYNKEDGRTPVHVASAQVHYLFNTRLFYFNFWLWFNLSVFSHRENNIKIFYGLKLLYRGFS